MHPSTREQILQVANLVEVAQDFVTFEKTGNNYYAKCPLCGKDGKGKGLSLNKSKGLVKCFSCDFGAATPFKFLTEGLGKSKDEAWEYLAQRYNVVENIYKTKKADKKSFCSVQLQQSGLTADDVRALIQTDEQTVVERDVFTEGTLDQYGNIVEGDDMIVWYYGLDGKQVMYTSQTSRNKKEQPFFRIRWSTPDSHLDKHQNPIKYQSPSGSGTHLFIPQKIRTLYNSGAKIETLYLQEGEKKSEKGNKHGIISVGLGGINAIGQNGHLPYELQLIVKRCSVKNVVLVFDADWKDISAKPKDGFHADIRPKNFYYAAKNYRDYFKAFVNLDIYLELYIAGIRYNGKDKGLDDLLNNQLKNQEDKLLEDFKKTLNLKNGEGEYVEMIKITDMVDLKLAEIWNLHDSYKFAEQHKEKLQGLKEFYIQKLKWKYTESGELKLAQPLMPDELFYEKEDKLNRDGEITGSSYSFNYEYAYNFLRNRGFWKIRMANHELSFVEIRNRTIKMVDNYYIRDFATNFAKTSIKSTDRNKYMNMIYRGGAKYFGPDSLKFMDEFVPVLELDDKYSQKMYFQKEFWVIKADSISGLDYSHMERFIWEEKINDFAAVRLQTPLFSITKITQEMMDKNKNLPENFLGMFTVTHTEDAANCHFAQFLWDTGDFYWEKHRFRDADTRSNEELAETAVQFVSKMSAIGYLLHTYFDAANPKAIIGMDGKLSEVGKSNGGSGKSLVGEAVGRCIPQVKINGKKKNMEEDKHLFERVNEKTDNVFIDDVRVNFDFEQLFPHITGTFEINPKGFQSFVIPAQLTPKIYIPTNHSLNGEGSSFRRRQFTIPFSDFYSDTYSPRDKFGINFFSEWGFEQWNLFYNFMAECVQVYLRWGFVDAPTERLEQRRLRQAIGEDFIDWADEYFMFNEDTGKFISGGNLVIGRDIARKELYSNFFANLPLKSKSYWTSRKFAESFKKYCKFRGARFNPGQILPGSDQQIGGSNKSGSTEYFQLEPLDFTKLENKTPY